MAKLLLKEQVFQMRQQGMSYSQIQEKIKVSKGSLSLWLRAYPLSKERINALRANSDKRIERCRNTKLKKRTERLLLVRKDADTAIGSLSDRELLIAGFFLYWGEGGKTIQNRLTVSNTDPALLRVFIRWLVLLGVPKNRLRVRLHLYADMEITKEIEFWSRELGIPQEYFNRPYIKASQRTSLTHTQRFIHGTCNVILNDRDTAEFVLMGLEGVRAMFAPNASI